MLCPKCHDLGLRSKVQDCGQSGTLLAYSIYWDEDGNCHDHDPNSGSHHYECSNGHYFSITRPIMCWCGWGKKQAEKKERRTKAGIIVLPRTEV